MKKKDEEWAIFWCALLEPILFGAIEPEEVHAHLRKIASEKRSFPDGTHHKPSLSTLKRKLKTYRNDGFEGLARKPRKDRGKPRVHDQELIDRAVEIKRDQPSRSDRVINELLDAERKKTIPKSTLYRHLRRSGATRVKLGVLKKKVRRRFTRDHSNDLWVGDFEHGPYVLHDGEPVSTRLSAFIDSHSRLVVEGRYYYGESLDVLVDSLLRAIVRHGAPQDLYLDNAKVYHAKALRAACYSIHTRLIHRTKGDPAPGGVIERFFGTVQSQFESEVRAGSIMTLSVLNQSFAAWLDMSYHAQIHSETQQTPRARYDAGLGTVRRVDMASVLPLFMQRETRRVDPTFADIRLNGRFYRVDARLRGDRVEVRFDPFSDGTTVMVYSLEEVYLGEGRLHAREQGEEPTVEPTGKAKIDYLRMLRDKAERQQQQRHAGIDFRKAVASTVAWPFPDFARTCARLLGRSGELSDWTADELEALRKTSDRIPQLNPRWLEEAVAAAEPRVLTAVLFELRRIALKNPEPR
jgi:transposase InsO family protein